MSFRRNSKLNFHAVGQLIETDPSWRKQYEHEETPALYERFGSWFPPRLYLSDPYGIRHCEEGGKEMKMTLSEFMDYLSRVEAPDTKCGFDMRESASSRYMTEHDCDSACCIGGHAALLLGNEDIPPDDALVRLLTISAEDAHRICYPNCYENYQATLAQALRLLEHYSATGEVDWPRAMRADSPTPREYADPAERYENLHREEREVERDYDEYLENE
ncbi:MAG: hypothetical protein HC888_05245 [Candidatus Competibacteraceae bacterium]|nr:hypothetical protein [Candidatus Competibacteraceae bacterium]